MHRREVKYLRKLYAENPNMNPYICPNCGKDMRINNHRVSLLCDGYDNWNKGIATYRFECKCLKTTEVTIQKGTIDVLIGEKK